MWPENLNWLMLREYATSNRPLILPIGSVESHGGHLPISTDFLVASYVADVLARRNNWVSLPPVTYTVAVPSRIGNVDISPETFGNYLLEILAHFVNVGCRTFLIILGHGGPDMKNTIKTQCSRLHGSTGASIRAFHILRVLEELGVVDQSTDRHAGEWETSVLLFVEEGLVGKTDIYENGGEMKRLGVVGDPRKASKSKGEKYLDVVVREIERRLKTSEGFSCNW